MADESEDKPAAEKPAETSDSDEKSATALATTEAASSEPKRKKRKKKKRAAEAAPADEKPAGPELGPEGWERPHFVLDFPKDAELERLVRAFELGNYAFVREYAPKLASSSSDEAVRRAASELLRRIEPDPLVKILFAMSIALFAFMVFYAYRSHGH